MMTEQPEAQVAEQQTSTDSPPTETYGEPKGAFLFVVLMLVFYVGYWFVNWIQIFVLRGL